MTDREIMEQAADVLQAVREAPASKDEIQRAWIVSDLLRRRLAQPDQEPVAWMNRWGDLFKNPDDAERGQTLTPLYTALPQRKPWVGLTDEEVKSLPQWFPSHETAAVMPLIRAIEAAHGIKGEA